MLAELFGAEKGTTEPPVFEGQEQWAVQRKSQLNSKQPPALLKLLFAHGKYRKPSSGVAVAS